MRRPILSLSFLGVGLHGAIPSLGVTLPVLLVVLLGCAPAPVPATTSTIPLTRQPVQVVVTTAAPPSTPTPVSATPASLTRQPSQGVVTVATPIPPKPTAVPTITPAPSPSVAQVEMMDGTEIRLTGPLYLNNLYLFVGEGEMARVENVDLDYVEEVRRTGEAKFLISTAGSTIEVTSLDNNDPFLSGHDQSADKRIPLYMIRRIVLQVPTSLLSLDEVIRSSNPDAWDEQQGKLEMVDGTELHVRDLRLLDNRNPLPPYGPGVSSTVSLDNQAYQYWVDEKWLLQCGFSAEHSRVVELCSSIPLGTAHISLGFRIGGLTFRSLGLDTVRRVTPDSPRPPDKSGTPAPARTITFTGWDGSISTAVLSNLRFVQYEPALSGFRWADRASGWHIRTDLPTIKTDGKITNVALSRLFRIEFVEKYSNSRMSALSLVDGESMSVPIIGPGGGVWTAELEEGILGNLSSAVSVYIQFARVRSIDMTAS